jgi:hypothetical protein
MGLLNYAVAGAVKGGADAYLEVLKEDRSEDRDRRKEKREQDIWEIRQQRLAEIKKGQTADDRGFQLARDNMGFTHTEMMQQQRLAQQTELETMKMQLQEQLNNKQIDSSEYTARLNAFVQTQNKMMGENNANWRAGLQANVTQSEGQANRNQQTGIAQLNSTLRREEQANQNQFALDSKILDQEGTMTQAMFNKQAALDLARYESSQDRITMKEGDMVIDKSGTVIKERDPAPGDGTKITSNTPRLKSKSGDFYTPKELEEEYETMYIIDKEIDGQKFRVMKKNAPDYMTFRNEFLADEHRVEGFGDIINPNLQASFSDEEQAMARTNIKKNKWSWQSISNEEIVAEITRMRKEAAAKESEKYKGGMDIPYPKNTSGQGLLGAPINYGLGGEQNYDNDPAGILR